MGRSYAFLVLALAAAGLSAAQAGTLYKWVDGQGRVSYHDRPPPEGSEYRVEEKTMRSGEVAPDQETQPAGNVPVILYSAPKCASCDLARIYLDKRKVPYTEKNVESDIKFQEELKAKSGSVSVPTITVGEKVMKGYLESLLEGELDAAGYPKTGTAGSGQEAGAQK
ncbi:MAG: glutaredoxin family protein [Pseudomonadota bacterium]